MKTTGVHHSSGQADLRRQAEGRCQNFAQRSLPICSEVGDVISNFVVTSCHPNSWIVLVFSWRGQAAWKFLTGCCQVRGWDHPLSNPEKHKRVAWLYEMERSMLASENQKLREAIDGMAKGTKELQ